MNVFQEIMIDQAKIETRLGCPAGDLDAIERRLTHFAQMTGGKGFRTPKVESEGKRAAKKARASDAARKQLRKEREIGVDPVFKPKGQRFGVQARKDWQKASKEWDALNSAT